MLLVNYRPHYLLIAEAAHVFMGVDDQCISFTHAGNLLGGGIYQRHTGASILFHGAIFRPEFTTRGRLAQLFSYPFEQLKVKKVLSWIKSSNTDALAFLRKVGFKEIAVIPGVYVDGDQIIFAMDRGGCRWLDSAVRSAA